MFWSIGAQSHPAGYPSFLAGVFNARADHPSCQIWREHWSDAAEVGAEHQHRGHKETPRNLEWFRGVIFYDKPGLTGIDIIICTERTRCLSRREP